MLHTEEHFEIRVGEATVAGRIDRIDDLGNGAVAIVDYKTGKPRAQEDADESLQLSIYAIAAQEKWDTGPSASSSTISKKTPPLQRADIRYNSMRHAPRSQM